MPVIVGAGRSGTRLLRLMLDAHPEMSIPAETGFLPALSSLTGSDDDRRRTFFDTMTGFPTWPDLATSPPELWSALLGVCPFTTTDGVRAFYRLYAAQRGKTRFGDKTPDYCLQLPVVQSLLPEAHFVHLIRDGRDVAVSVRRLWFSPGNDIESIAADWVRRIQTARQQAPECAHYLELRYEDLVSRPRPELERICDFVRLDYSPAMQWYFRGASCRLALVQDRYHPESGVLLISREGRLANHRLTNEPPGPSRIGRWRKELTVDEQDRFWAVAGALLSELGYPRR